jgi:sulfide dehydrogenase cytochrome subunit
MILSATGDAGPVSSKRPTEEVSSGATLGSGCTGCHGTNGVTVGAALPTIAGLDRRYFMRVMREFKNGERPATIMGRIAAGYSGEELRRVAIYFSALPWVNSQPESPFDEEGRRIHMERCEECHEREGRHQDRDVSRIAGQGEKYLAMQLFEYRDGSLKSRQPEKMARALQGIDDDQLQTLAAFYAQQRDRE